MRLMRALFPDVTSDVIGGDLNTRAAAPYCVLQHGYDVRSLPVDHVSLAGWMEFFRSSWPPWPTWPAE